MAEFKHWYVLRVRLGFEALVARQLCRQGIEAFLPQHHVVPPRGPRSHKFLFAGYVVSRFALEKQQSVLTMPGVVSVIGLPKPAPLDDGEFLRLQATIGSGLPMEVLPLLPGQRVRVMEGPLCGLRGTIVERNGKRYFGIRVRLIDRMLAFELQTHWRLKFSRTGRRSPHPILFTVPQRAKAQ